MFRNRVVRLMRGTRFGGPAASQAGLFAAVGGGGGGCSFNSICREDTRLRENTVP